MTVSNSFSGSGIISGQGTFFIVPAGALLTGGTRFSDSTYYYTAFKTTGDNTFTIANNNLDVYMLSIGGGGNGSSLAQGGGGGAGSVDWTALTLTAGTYNAQVGAATQNTNLIKGGSTLFTSYAGGDGGSGVRGASTGGGNGGASTNPGGSYTYGGAAGHIGNAGGAGQGGSTTARKGGGGGGAGGPGGAGGSVNGSVAGNGGVGLAIYKDLCAIVGIGEDPFGGGAYVGGGGGGGRGAAQNSHGTHGWGIGANTGGGGDGGSGGTRTNGGYSGVIVLKYLKTAVSA
jgi:hypothetical protein